MVGLENFLEDSKIKLYKFEGTKVKTLNLGGRENGYSLSSAAGFFHSHCSHIEDILVMSPIHDLTEYPIKIWHYLGNNLEIKKWFLKLLELKSNQKGLN